MKRKILLLILISISLICLSSCDSKSDVQIRASVVIKADYELINSEIILNSDNVCADDVIIRACQQKKLAYTYQNGMFDGFGGLKSTMSDGWLLYVDGVLAEVGAKDILIKDGNVIEFRYENYDSAFLIKF